MPYGDGLCGTAFKPSKLDRDLKKFAKQQQSETAKRAAKRKAENEWRVLSLQVCARAKGICQVSGAQTTKYGKGDPRLWGQAHHLVMRSAGGRDEMSNLIWVTYETHTKIHAHQIEVTGTADNFTVRETTR